jgi:hypothetical protein
MELDQDAVDPADAPAAETLARSRVEVDPMLSAVIRARAASALFGTAAPV